MDRKIQRRRRVWRIVRAAVLAQLFGAVFLADQNFAQEGRGGRGRGGGFPSPEEQFNNLDANQDGRLSADEINSNGFTSRVFREVDTSRGLSRDDFVRESERIRERFRNGGFGRGRGGPGGFGGDREGRGRRGGDDSDRRRDRDGAPENGGNSPSGDKPEGTADSPTPNGTPPAEGATPQGPKPRQRVTVDLQADLLPGDTDNDGQIGLYEWRRFAGHTLKEFRELDRNDDGFVTPAEVAAVRPPVTPPPAATPAPTAGATPATTPPPTNPPPAGSVPAATPAPSTSSVAPTGGNSERAARDAKTFFRLLDKDRDGKIAADEWQDGNTKTLFTKNGIDLSQPMSAEDFTSNYMRLSTVPSGG